MSVTLSPNNGNSLTITHNSDQSIPFVNIGILNDNAAQKTLIKTANNVEKLHIRCLTSQYDSVLSTMHGMDKRVVEMQTPVQGVMNLLVLDRSSSTQPLPFRILDCFVSKLDDINIKKIEGNLEIQGQEFCIAVEKMIEELSNSVDANTYEMILKLGAQYSLLLYPRLTAKHIKLFNLSPGFWKENFEVVHPHYDHPKMRMLVERALFQKFL